MVLTTRPRRRTDPRIVVAKAAVHLAALAPLTILLWQMWGEWKGVSHALGADPVAEIEHRLGLWALRFLMLTLAITPLRQLTGWNQLVRFRRMLGLYAFAYASLHFAAYLGLDLRGFWAQVLQDIVKRPYITVGFIAWLLLVPLAVTSTTGWIKRLGRNWTRLHKLVYGIAVLAVLHFWWLVKSDLREPALYAGIAALLLGWRAWKALQARAGARAKTRSAPSARA